MDKNNIPQGIVYYSKIHAISFYVLGDEENTYESNVNITNKEVMKNDRPMSEGVYDAHMGTTDHSWNCLTCGNRKTVCPGHFGSVDVKYTVKSPMFRDEILKWLKIVCHHCGSIVMPIKMRVKPAKRLNEMVKAAKQIKECPTCHKPHYSVVKDKDRSAVFYRVQEEGKTLIHKEQLYNNQIKQILQRIRDDDVLLMGKPLRSHPAKFALNTIRAPPNTIRPDIRRIGGARSSNSDTTALLKTIVEINDALPDEVPQPEQISQDLENIYFNIDMTYHAMIKGGGGGSISVVANNNKAPVALAERFPKKTGRIRRNLMGKRVEYMIRSVITGDSRLKIYEVGIPISHARNLEIPETVSKHNYDRMMVYFTNKTDIYPGCKRIIKKANGKAYRLNLLDPTYQLQIGDIVMRDMIDGDYICFNRQPSLLFSNIAGMRVVIMTTGDTLRINPAVCNYFNADFDGDQMNCIVPQSIPSRVECMMISKVARWFISPQTQAPLVGSFQDGCIGLAEITKQGLSFNKWHAMSVFSDIQIDQQNIVTSAALTFNGKTFTNRSLVSKLLPEINVIGKTPSLYREEYAPLLKYNPSDIKVNIIRGELQSGILDKDIAGQGVLGSIFHIIANEYGNDASMSVVYNLQQLVHKFFMYHGFTTGISDINVSLDAMTEIKRRIAGMITESRKLTQRMNNGKLIAPLGVTLQDFYENVQMNALSPADDFVYPIYSDIDLNNNSLLRLILTGSKGKPLNFISINAAIGTQTINGRRFKPQAGWGRTSPYFMRYDTEPDASGYISTSFREGVKSESYAFMAGEARHGQIANALSTSISGYQNRISIKNLETIMVDNLRKSTKGLNVIQPLYAECGIDPSKMEKVKFHTVSISDAEFADQFHMTVEKYTQYIDEYETKNNMSKDTLKKLFDAEFEQLKADREEYRNMNMQLEAHNPKEYIMSNTKHVPVNVPRIIDDTIYHYAELNESLNDGQRILNPIDLTKAVKELCDDLGYVFLNEIQKKLKRQIPHYIIKSTKIMQILIRSYLCMSYLIKKKVGNAMLGIIIEKIILVYKKSLMDYGSTCGVLAAQCLSEPLVQFVLNSKHRSGGLGGTQTNEIVRIQEILGAKDTDIMKNPRMLIMVKPEHEHDKLKVQEIANHIEMMKFGMFIVDTRIFFEEYGKPTHSQFKHEAGIIASIEKHHFGQKVPNDLSKWCIRFTMDKEGLIIKSMKLETLILALRREHPEIFIVHTPETADIVFVRCYLRNTYFKQTSNYFEDNVIPLMKKIKDVIVRGVKDIISVGVIDVVKTVKQNNGALDMKKVYGIYTVGTNLSEILANPYIDPYRTQSDSIEEIERIFGIVAARHKIMNELVNVLKSISRMHCGIFADEMTYSGAVTSIQKTGLQKREMANITLRLSFQTPIQVIQEAAINGLTDHISGISGPLIMGTNPNIGTTYNTIIVDENFVKSNVKSLSTVIDEL